MRTMAIYWEETGRGPHLTLSRNETWARFGRFVALPEADIGFVFHPVSGVRMGQRRRLQWERQTSPGLLFGLARQRGPAEGHERDLATNSPFSYIELFLSLCLFLNILLWFSLSSLFQRTLQPPCIPAAAGRPWWEAEHKLRISPDWIISPPVTLP